MCALVKGDDLPKLNGTPIRCGHFIVMIDWRARLAVAPARSEDPSRETRLWPLPRDSRFHSGPGPAVIVS